MSLAINNNDVPAISERNAALSEAADACMRATPDRAKVRAIGEAAHYAACRDAVLALKTSAPLAEAITWKAAADLPDADSTVMLFDPAASEPVWPGYYDGERWLYADGMPAAPTHYADMLKGPRDA